MYALLQLPPYLLLTLKRFQYNATTMQRTKVSHAAKPVTVSSCLQLKDPICFPTMLSMRPYTEADDEADDDGSYELVAAINHVGAAVQAGHYYAWVSERCYYDCVLICYTTRYHLLVSV